MSIQNINVGSAEMSGDGETIRQAFVKINSNFQHVLSRAEVSVNFTEVPTSSVGKAGDVAGMMAADPIYFYYCTGTYNGVTSIWKRSAWDQTAW